MDIVLIDHYDSFTNNVRDWLLSGGFSSVKVIAYDRIDEVLPEQTQGIVFSPGPKSPLDIEPSRQLLERYIGKVPILGVCLGHQLMASYFGWGVEAAKSPLHGARRLIRVVEEHPFFKDLGVDFYAASYNSLAVLPPKQSTVLSRKVKCLAVCQDGDIQALEIDGANYPCLGVQFHPESFLTPQSTLMAKNLFSYFSGQF